MSSSVQLDRTSCWYGEREALEKSLRCSRMLNRRSPSHNGCGKDFCTSRTGSFTPTGSAAAEQAFVAHGRHVGDTYQNSTLSFGLQVIAPEAFHRGTFLPSLHLILEVSSSLVSYHHTSLFSADDERKDERNRGTLSQALEVMAAEQAFVACGRHAGGTDPNSTVWAGGP